MECAKYCVHGCQLRECCPHLATRDQAIQFIEQTPWEELMRLAEEDSPPNIRAEAA